MVGPYRLLDKIGEGGFGEVWLAERREPMVQRVAVKLIKPGMDSRAVIARFEQERQALAVMDHPNVARVLDGGVTSAGRPYFVMEHVKGEPITAFADRNRLTIRERLELFVPVCDAVQHAHMKGIIHRDIKPSNILVAPVGDSRSGDAATPRGLLVKVIDFGVAKAVSHTLTDKTIFTEQGQIIGTPEYMSPEQAEMGATDVDTRSDVYSLGVVLYELLSGTLPFDTKTLRSAGYAEIQRIIREVDPPKPSTKLSTADDRLGADIAQARQAERERIAVELRRELEWIPMKALRKDRTRRYPSAESLGADVRRYLAGEPLEAAPENRAYLVRKFVRRNRLQVTAVGAVAVALVAGFGTALWQAREASLQRDAAVRAEQAEKLRADQLARVSDFQTQALSQIDTKVAGIELMEDLRERFAAALSAAGVPEAERAERIDALDRELSRVNATDAAAEMIDRTILKPAIKTIEARFEDDPKTDAALRQAVADLYRSIGLYDAALPLQESALSIRRRVQGDDHPDTLRTSHAMALQVHLQGRRSEAEMLYRDALDRCRRVLGEDDPDTIRILSGLGSTLLEQGRLDEAEPFYVADVEKSRRILGEDHPGTVTALNNMAQLRRAQGRYAEAESTLRDALERAMRALGEDHPMTLSVLGNLGIAINSQGRAAEAEPYYRRVHETRTRVLGAEHPETVIALSNLGLVLDRQGHHALAEQHLRQALEIRRRTLGSEHPGTLGALGDMTETLRRQGKLAESEAFARETLEGMRRVLGSDHADTITAIAQLSSTLSAKGDPAGAEPFAREALERSRRVLGDEHPDTLSFTSNLAVVLQTLGKQAEAERSLLEALALSRRILGDDHPKTVNAINNMGVVLQSQQRFAEAEPYLREALETNRRLNGVDHPATLRCINNIGGLLESQGRYAEAEPYFRQALEGRRRTLGDENPQTLASVGGLGTVLELQGKYDEAVALLAPHEQAFRTAFTGGNAWRISLFLASLGRARASGPFDSERFQRAERDLLEAYPQLKEAKQLGPKHRKTLDCARGLVALYGAWESADPGKGFREQAERWQQVIDGGDSADAGRDQAGDAAPSEPAPSARSSSVG